MLNPTDSQEGMALQPGEEIAVESDAFIFRWVVNRSGQCVEPHEVGAVLAGHGDMGAGIVKKEPPSWREQER